jgi:hypothetical protein
VATRDRILARAGSVVRVGRDPAVDSRGESAGTQRSGDSGGENASGYRDSAAERRSEPAASSAEESVAGPQDGSECRTAALEYLPRRTPRAGLLPSLRTRFKSRAIRGLEATGLVRKLRTRALSRFAFRGCASPVRKRRPSHACCRRIHDWWRQASLRGARRFSMRGSIVSECSISRPTPG